MAEITVRFDLRFDKRTLRLLMAGAFLLGMTPELASENVTLNTYYPAPSGIYTQLVTTGNTILARDSGNVQVGTGAPAYKLDVFGDARAYQFHWQNSILQSDQGGTIELGGNNSTAGVGTPYIDFHYAWGSAVDYDTRVINDGHGQLSFFGTTSTPPGNPAPNVGLLNISNGALIGTYGLMPGYAAWSQFGTGAGGAAIYNDGSTYQALMLVGNSANGSGRQVAVWDELNINGTLLMNSGVGNVVVPINDCSFVGFVAGVTTCAGNQYVTLTSGIDNKYTIINNGVDPTGDMLCCTCPWQRVDGNGSSGGISTANGNCPAF